MEQTVPKKEEKQLLVRFRYLSQPQRREALDFLGYLLAKREWGANFEVTEDKELMASFKEGLKDLDEGDVEEVEL